MAVTPKSTFPMVRQTTFNRSFYWQTHCRPYVYQSHGFCNLGQFSRRNNKTGKVEKHQIGALFSMTGAMPNSVWLEGRVMCDDAGFIKTGSDLSKEDLERAKWPLSRAPYYLKQACRGCSPSATFAVATLSASHQLLCLSRTLQALKIIEVSHFGC